MFLLSLSSFAVAACLVKEFMSLLGCFHVVPQLIKKKKRLTKLSATLQDLVFV